MDTTSAHHADGQSTGTGDWYVIRTKAREEMRSIDELSRVGVQTLCPLVREYRVRRRKVEKVPMFPGYIFARFSYPANYYTVKWARGVQDLVRFGDGPPVPVDDGTIQFFTSRMDHDGLVDLDPGLKPGDPVRFRTEPFKDLVGTILRMDDAKGRILVLLELLYQARVEVDAYQIQAL